MWNLVYGMDHENASLPLFARAPCPELQVLSNDKRLEEVNKLLEVMPNDQGLLNLLELEFNSFEAVTKLSSPRVIRTHFSLK